MIRLQVVGLPLKTYRRLQPQIETWVSALDVTCSVRFSPSFQETTPQIGKREIMQIKQNIQEGFVHIAVLPVRDWSVLKSQFHFDCRIPMLAVPGDFRGLTWEQLEVALTQVLGFEERWCKAVKPSDFHHPLMLPPPSFEIQRVYRDFWRQCDCYRNTELLTDANNVVQGVRAAHRRSASGIGVYWLDCGKKRFSIDRSWHALSQEERLGKKRFRFCFEIPQGFHFDVVHDSGSDFCLRGKDRVYDRINRANVDSWGTVRLA